MGRFIIASILCLAGCPQAHCPTTPHIDANRALRLHRSLSRTVHAIRAEARVDQRGQQGRIRGTVMMILERPDRIRFDAMTQFGPAATLTSNGSQLQLLDRRENRFFEGPACPSNIARLLGMAIEGNEMIRFFMGDTPRLDHAETAMSCSEGEYLISLQAENGKRQEIVVRARAGDEEQPPHAQHLRLSRSTMFHPDGSLDWYVHYEDYRVVQDPHDEQNRGVAFPFVVRFRDPDRGIDTRIRIKNIELLTESPSANVFQQDPTGIEHETISCEEEEF